MLWHVKSYNGFNLDNGDYYAMLLVEDNPFMLPSIDVGVVGHGDLASDLSGFRRKSDDLIVTVMVKQKNHASLVKELNAAFNNLDANKKWLVAEEDVSGAQWSVLAKVVNISRHKGLVYKVHLSVPDRIWRKLATEIVWNVTSSPATQNVTNAGNMTSYPVITFIPRATKTTGFDYRHWVPILNPQSDRAFVDWGLDLTDGGLDTRPWVADASISNQANGAITSGAASIPIDTPVGGGLPTHGMGYLVNGGDVSQIAWTGMTGTPTSGTLTGVTWSIGGTSPHNFPDNTVIKLSYMQADGADLRFYSKGLEQDMWVRSPNTAATKMWINADAPAGIQLTLLTPISNVGDVSEMEFIFGPDNVAAMHRMQNTGVIVLNDEAFHYWGLDILHAKVFTDARAINDTSPGSHSVFDTAYVIEAEGWLYSGNAYLDARVNDDTRKPLLDLDASDNDTRVYYEFYDRANLRTGAWKPSVMNVSYPDLRSTRYYTGNQTDETPTIATEMGMRMMSTFNGRWNFENGKVAWTFYDPAGIYQVSSWVFEKYKLGSVWPATAALLKSKDGLLYYNVSAVAAPITSNSWGSPSTVGPFLMGTGYFFLQTLFSGNITAGNVGGVGYEADLETNAITYITVAPLIPEIRARNIQAYQINGEFVNDTSEDLFKLDYTMNLNEELEIDCERRIATTLVDGIRRRSVIFLPNDQMDWMRFLKGINALRYIEAGITNMDIKLAWYDMLVV